MRQDQEFGRIRETGDTKLIRLFRTVSETLTACGLWRKVRKRGATICKFERNEDQVICQSTDTN